MRRMIKAFLFIFEPAKTWDQVARASRGFWSLCFLNLLPMAVLAAAAEGYGLVRWGKYVETGYHGLRKFPVSQAVVYEILQTSLLLLLVFILAQTLRSLGTTFHGRNTFTHGFTVVVHGLSPFFVLRLFDAFPVVHPWVSWSIGILLSMAILYQGLPRVMLPDPPHALGLYLVSCLVLLLATGLLRFLTAWYLGGHFQVVEQWISALAARLPF